MKGDHIHFSSASEEWGTPPDFYKKLDEEFHFTLDPCTTPDNPLGTEFFYTQADNGLSIHWDGNIVFCNPPYGDAEEVCDSGCNKKRCIKRGWHRIIRKPGVREWLMKGFMASTAVYLLPARLDTAWFHDFCWPIKYRRDYANEIRFIRGRLKFRGAKWPAPFPSMLVIFR